MMERFIIKAGSESLHCCFAWSIVDTETDSIICEGFDDTFAQLICEKLNLWGENLIKKTPNI